ncbi:GatB/YqeY domain-containing protein [Natronoflexus pectinivorans]|uniref:Glutamyl-tRNA amidotransferase n=1 Tax=Natronoflexus pectinivorans TaxID=682526 RepID=A0A4R2GAH2_9BACT|nr:GatB/YqeY domain-containing protein [Natronoflexus pectinivorans]TCO04948.1 hypothetical protein EV194_11713 [Natronoflexus pectinivorans]
MSLFEKVNEDIKAAMKAREKVRLDALRSIKKELLEARTAKNAGGEVSESDEVRILQKMVKQRRDSAEIYATQNRQEMADQENQEAEVISGYLPVQLTAEELESAVKEIIVTTGASSMKEMGKVMGVASSMLAGKADGKDISAMVKKLLS